MLKTEERKIYAVKPSSTDLLLHVFCEVFKLCVMLKMDPFLNLTDEGLTETLTTGTSRQNTRHATKAWGRPESLKEWPAQRDRVCVLFV